MLGHFLREVDSNLEKNTTVHANIPFPWKNPVRRHGHPRIDWTTHTMTDIWNMFREALGEQQTEFDETSREHIQTINMLAHI